MFLLAPGTQVKLRTGGEGFSFLVEFDIMILTKNWIQYIAEFDLNIISMAGYVASFII